MKTKANRVQDYKKAIISGLVAVVLFLAAHYLGHEPSSEKSHERQVERLQSALQEKQQQIHQQQERIIRAMAENGAEGQEKLFRELMDGFTGLYAQQGIIHLVYQNDHLVFWSDHRAPVLQELGKRRNYRQQAVQELKNGIYLTTAREEGEYTLAGLLLIQKKYPFQNKYLENKFNPALPVEVHWNAVAGEAQEGFPVTNAEGDVLFSLVHEEDAGNHIAPISAGLFVLGLFFIILFLWLIGNWIARKNLLGGFAFFTIALLLVRWLMLRFQYPQEIYALPLFDPAILAFSAVFPSLGDLILNLVTLFLIVWFLVRHWKTDPRLLRTIPLKVVLSSLLLFLVMALSEPVTLLFKRLIFDSDVSFRINELFSLDLYSYIGLAGTALLLFTYYLLIDKAAQVFSGFRFQRRYQLSALLSASLLFAIYAWFRPVYEVPVALLTLGIVYAVLVDRMRMKQSRSLASAGALLLIFSLFAVWCISSFNAEKERTDRIFAAHQLANEQDPVAEYLFSQVRQELLNDRLIKSYMTVLPDKKAELISRLEQKYFNDFRQKYDLFIHIYGTEDTLLASTSEGQPPPLQEFQSLASQSPPALSQDLYFTYEVNEEISYLSLITFKNPRSEERKRVTMVLGFKHRGIGHGFGFPELLLDRNIESSAQWSEYSIAKYHHRRLIGSYGDFVYRSDISRYEETEAETSWREFRDYDHLLYRPDEHSLIVVSRPLSRPLDRITSFSFLFMLYGLFVLLLFILYALVSGQPLMQNNFKNRINAALISMLTVFVLLVGVGTVYYVIEQYNEKNEEVIREKVQSVLIELTHKLSERDKLEAESTDYLTYLLTKFSKVFFTDINLYGLDGHLLASSRPRIFDEGIVSEQMNAVAFREIAAEDKEEFIHNESIGKLRYMSAYVPFENEEGKLQAYMNLPYFARQDGLQQEILTLLSALINIYVLLIVIAIVIALFISEQITEPFRLISRNMQQVKLGEPNREIEWESEDEVGELIREYNRMIEKLGESAELLAKSERESAWREMAKQVAHEIKNPLTPMKLSVQQLQRSYKDKTPGWDEKIDRIAQTLIEQIDTLAHIATEFSNFAKMPRAENRKIKLNDVLEGAVELHKDTENVALTFDDQSGEAVYVFADREQLQRVFTNLIKNAVQSIPDEREGNVKVKLQKLNDMARVSVSDNGTGIEEGLRDKIFAPNFTTKTAGMGLGLAMAKNIIEIAGGEITFETEEGAGSTFYVELPVYRG